MYYLWVLGIFPCGERMKKKLILATNSFPYNTGEKSFILPELERLRKQYDITVISHADAEQRKLDYVEPEILEDIQVLCFPRPDIRTGDKVRALVSFLLSADGWQEIGEICRGGGGKKQPQMQKGRFSLRGIMQQFYQSLSFYAQAQADRKELRASGILSGTVPVIYYSFWNTYYCYSMVREKRKYPNVRIFSRLHGFDLYHERVPGARQPLKQQMEKGTDGLIFLGDFALNYYRERIQGHKPSDTPLYVCPLGTEAPTRRMPPPLNGTWQLLSCSSVIPLKRVERIVDGLASVKAEKTKIHWIHIGGGAGLESLREYAAERLKDKENIQYSFAGQMEHEEVVRYYGSEQADCFITTSSTEGVPVSVMEAMSYGIPVIAAPVGGIPEMIQGNGILLSADPAGEEVAAALQEMCRMEAGDMAALKDRSYELWESRFAIEATARRLMEILETVE